MLHCNRGISSETLKVIADGVFDTSLTSTALLLKAEKTQKISLLNSMKENSVEKQDKSGNSKKIHELDETEIYWANRPRSGVNWGDVFTDEDKFGFQILKNEGFKDYFSFQYLRFLRNWGDEIAEEKINQIIAIGNKQRMKAKNGVNNQEREGINMEIYQTEKLGRMLYENSKIEMDSLISGIGGEYVLPAPGGDVIRDGVGVLPTGRNIHALDPYRIPSPVAMERGRLAAKLIIEAHREKGSTIVSTSDKNVPLDSLFDNHKKKELVLDPSSQESVLGPYPQTIAVTLWGLDTIKTKGESVAILLALVGAEPVREATGRIVGFELVPLSVLGRPRIDVLASMSGIFRDSFANVLDLLDDLFERTSLVDEPIDMNYIKKHTDELKVKGVERPFSRLFSNPPGDFGSMVNEQIGSGEWTDGKELGSTWEGRNSFSYGRQTSSVGKQSSIDSDMDLGSNSGIDRTAVIDTQISSGSGSSGRGTGTGTLQEVASKKKSVSVSEASLRGNKGQSEGGKYRPDVLSALLSSTDRIVQEIDSVE